MRGTFQIQPGAAAGEETGPERVADPGGIHPLDLGNDADAQGRAVGGDQIDPVCAQGGDSQAHLLAHLRLGPPGLGQHQVPLVVIAEQVGRSVDELADLLAGQPGQLLGRIGGEAQAQFPTLLGMVEHRRRVVGADDHQFGLARCRDDVRKPDVAGPRHRARVERRDLGHVQICRAHEPCGVLSVGDQNVLAVDARRLQPFPVVGEVDTGRTDQQRATAEHTDRIGHVAGHPAVVNHEVLDQEAQRHLLQMLGEELFGKPPGETHQVVGGNGSGHRDGHGHPLRRVCASLLKAALKTSRL